MSAEAALDFFMQLKNKEPKSAAELLLILQENNKNADYAEVNSVLEAFKKTNAKQVSLVHEV